jgi:hypothetical protein
MRSSARHGPDRSRLIIPGFRSSRVQVLNAADDPLKPTVERVISRKVQRRDSFLDELRVSRR